MRQRGHKRIRALTWEGSLFLHWQPGHPLQVLLQGHLGPLHSRSSPRALPAQQHRSLLLPNLWQDPPLPAPTSLPSGGSFTEPQPLRRGQHIPSFCCCHHLPWEMLGDRRCDQERGWIQVRLSAQGTGPKVSDPIRACSCISIQGASCSGGRGLEMSRAASTVGSCEEVPMHWS